eukprot:scaffold2527_cov224-Chaetoceros_neogracile.AAC.3
MSNGKETKEDSHGSVQKSLALDAVIPILAEDKITQADLLTAAKVLSAISKFHPKHKTKIITQDGRAAGVQKRSRDESVKLYQDPHLRPIRKAIASVFELHKLQMYNGSSEEDFYANRIAERSVKRQKQAEKIQQKKYIADTELRRGRIVKLEKLKMDSKEEEESRLKVQAMMIPDGHVDTEGDMKMLEGGAQADDPTGDDQAIGIRLPKLRSCYVCKVRYRDLHPFYDQLCPSCAKLNFEKRHFKVDLTRKVSVVTGSRVKIGYQVCLKLLRAGCKVVATTRFPNSAAATYKKEKDFDDWKDRLCIYGLDFRDVIGLEAFTRFLKMKYGEQGIDILINNACQTVRRPTGYYQPIVEREANLWKEADQSHKDLLENCLEFENVRRKLLIDEQKSTKGSIGLQQSLKSQEGASRNVATAEEDDDVSLKMPGVKEVHDEIETSVVMSKREGVTAPFESTGISHSAAMSQMVILPDDVGISSDILPQGLSDINGHQIDMRKSNSWLLKLDQVSTPELMECMFINAIAPFVLNSRLQPLMATPHGIDRPDRYIINVSAMEGKFYRYKMPNHPHTNMAKAALNMLTRTSSEELAKKYRIFMNSVDTGWINDENPLEKASKIAKTNLFQTPIDEIDAAARILDPVFVGVEIDNSCSGGEKKKKEYGKFFKDFRETEW